MPSTLVLGLLRPEPLIQSCQKEVLFLNSELIYKMFIIDIFH